MIPSQKIAIAMGGFSEEAPISIKSGNTVYERLRAIGYNLYRVYILKESWFCLDSNDKKHPIDKTDFSTVINGSKINFDLVFNAIHGLPGENGLLQAYWDLVGVKYTGSGFYESALCFNKKDCLSVVRQYGIHTAKAYHINKETPYNPDEVIQQVGLPCFVKPNQSGSSLGASKVVSLEELKPAINNAFIQDNSVIVETFLEGIEISVGVVSYKGSVITLPITELVSHGDFFDYAAKYEGKSKEITPARISEIQRENAFAAAKTIHEKLNLEGFSRTEFIFVNQTPYFLEVNTIPGLTPQSILPQQLEKQGISLTDFLEDQIISKLNKICLL